VLKNPEGEAITSIDGWTRPKRQYQWKPGRSAMELAASWFRSGACACPSELAALLDSHRLTRDWQFVDGCPELVTALPQRGEGRNHDLWLKGSSAGGPLTVCIEAKVDEPFGNRIGESVDAALRQNAHSGLPARARALLHLLTGMDVAPEAAPWRDLRYQLLTACAGTAIQASFDHSQLGVFVVQEFTGPGVDAALQRQNDEDLKLFVRDVLDVHELQDGMLVGPTMIRSGPALPSDVQLLVGKIRSSVAG
jgi:hypothetical protein